MQRPAAPQHPDQHLGPYGRGAGNVVLTHPNRFRDLETTLQMYAGALDEPTAQYSAKAFAEKARLDALRQKAKKQQSA
jgi:hypothetical protein